MSSLTNQATLLGTVTSEPEFHQTDDGGARLRFDLTTLTRWGGDDHVKERKELHPVEVHDTFARRLYGHLALGHQVLCEGTVRSRVDAGARTVVVEASIVHDLGAPSPDGGRPSRNGVVLLGNVGGTPVLQQVGSTALLTFRLATKSHDDPEPEWHTIKVWGRRAEALERILASGHKLGVAAELRHERYEDAQGRPQHAAALHAHEIQLLARPSVSHEAEQA